MWHQPQQGQRRRKGWWAGLGAGGCPCRGVSTDLKKLIIGGLQSVGRGGISHPRQGSHFRDRDTVTIGFEKAMSIDFFWRREVGGMQLSKCVQF